MSQVIYCRVPLPEGGGPAGNIAATREAVYEVFAIMGRTTTDPADGELRVTYVLDSAFEGTSALAEWRSNN